MTVILPAHPNVKGLYNATDATISRWQSALDSVRSGGRNARCLFVGDSKTLGVGGGDNVPGDGMLNARFNSVPGVVSRLLTSQIPTSYCSWWAGMGLTTTTVFEAEPGLSRTGSGWIYDGNSFGGVPVVNSTDTTSVFKWIIPQPCTEVDLWCPVTQTGNNTFAVSVDGGAYVNFTANYAVVTQHKQTIQLGALGMHNISVKRVAGKCFLAGMEARDATAPKCVVVTNAGFSGSTTQDWTDGSGGSAVYGPIPMIMTLAPDIMVLGLSTNDERLLVSSFDDGSFVSRMQRIINAGKVSGDVVIVLHSEVSLSSVTAALQARARDILSQLALDNNCAVFDNREVLGGSYAAATASAQMYDTLHENKAGYAQLGAFQAAALVAQPAATTVLDTSEASVWLVDINTETLTEAGYGFPEDMPMGGPAMTMDLVTDIVSNAPKVAISDMGFTTEPGDSVAPNVFYPPRLVSAPQIVRDIPIYPEDERRSTSNEAELVIQNGDGAYNGIASDWRLAGLPVVIRRGPLTTPFASDLSTFTRVAEMRATNAPKGRDKLKVPVVNLSADLSMGVCERFLGTGGTDGLPTLTGQTKQLLLGMVPNIQPIQITANLIFMVSNGAIQQVMAVRDIGLPLTFSSDVPTFSALDAITVPNGTYVTCLALGLIKLANSPTELTVDARGAVTAGGYGGGTPMQIATQLLRGPGGISASRAAALNFSSWIFAEAGMVVRDGSVADAISRLARGIIGWWGADNFGNFIGGQIAPPESLGPVFFLRDEGGDITDEPTEVTQARPPWWRATVGYAGLDLVQTKTGLSAALTDDALRTRYTTANQNAVSYNLENFALFPKAEDAAPIPAVLANKEDADAVAFRAMALFGKQRRAWQVPVREAIWANPLVVPGACINVSHAAIPDMVDGQNFIVQQVVGQAGSGELIVWG